MFLLFFQQFGGHLKEIFAWGSGQLTPGLVKVSGNIGKHCTHVLRVSPQFGFLALGRVQSEGSMVLYLRKPASIL